LSWIRKKKMLPSTTTTDDDTDQLLLTFQNTYNSVKNHLPVDQTDFDRFLSNQQKEQNEPTDLRELLLACSRHALERGRWSTKHAEELRRLLTLLKEEGFQEKFEDIELQHVDFASLLAHDKHQHDFNVAVALRSVLGWLCVSIACYLPWVTSLAYYLVIYGNEQIHLLNVIIAHTNANSTSKYPATQIEEACNICAIYVFGFFILLLVSLAFSLSVALAQAVDNKRNMCVSPVSGWLASFLTFAVLAYNLFGVVAVWNFALWDVRANSTVCFEIRSLAVSVLIMFLLIPLICFVLSAIRHRTQRTTVDDTLYFRAPTGGNNTTTGRGLGTTTNGTRLEDVSSTKLGISFDPGTSNRSTGMLVLGHSSQDDNNNNIQGGMNNNNISPQQQNNVLAQQQQPQSISNNMSSGNNKDVGVLNVT
jgi:hypothetical protein